MQRLVRLAIVVVLVAGCGGSAAPATAPVTPSPATNLATASVEPSPMSSTAPSSSPIATASTEPSTNATASPATASGAFVLDAQIWFSGFAISITGGSYEPGTHALVIDASFLNTSGQQSELRNLSSSTSISWAGQILTAYVTSGVVAAGATATGKIQVQTPPGFVIADAILAFGQLDQYRATVSLNGGPATSEQPSPLVITGKVQIGKLISYTITSAMLVPASCGGYPDRIGFGPLNADLVSIVVWGTVRSADPTNYGQIDRGYVIASGVTTTSNPPMSLSVPNKATIKNIGMCFAVPTPGSGTYALKMHEYRSKATGTLQFLVP